MPVFRSAGAALEAIDAMELCADAWRWWLDHLREASARYGACDRIEREVFLTAVQLSADVQSTKWLALLGPYGSAASAAAQVT